MTRPQINPSKTVHSPPPPVKGVNRLTPKQIFAFGTIMVDLILAQVALALSGVGILGIKPFAFLANWAADLTNRAQDAYNNAFGAQATANTAVANAAAAQSTANTANSEAVTAYNSAVTANTSIQTTWDNINKAVTGTGATGATAGTVYSNIYSVTGTASSAYTTAVGASGAAATANTNIQATWDSINQGVTGTGATGATAGTVKTVVTSVTGTASTAYSTANTASTNVQTTIDGINQAVTGTGATGATAGTVATNVGGVVSTARGIVQSGSNLLVDPGGENSIFWSGQTNVTRSSTVKRSGSYSVRLTSSGATARTLYFNTVDTGAVAAFTVTEGQVYYVECWVYAPTGNTGLGTVELIAQTNGSTITAIDSVTLTSGTKATWLELSGNFTIPASITTASFGVRLAASATTANDLFYVDDMQVWEITKSQNIIDSMTSGLGNKDTLSTGFSTSDVLSSTYGTANSLVSLSDAVAALKSNSGGSSTGGNSASVAFSGRANASSLGSDFTQVYSGSGTSTLGIVSGQADWIPSGTADRSCIAVYNAVQTVTNYQIVGVTMSGYQMSGFYSGYPNVVCGRMNSAGTSYVYASIVGGFVELGCVVSGSKTVFTTAVTSTQAAPGMTFVLQCGTSGGERVYKVVINGKALITWPESGTTSQLGSSYRYSGFGTVIRNGSTPAAPLSAFSMNDNNPVSVLGSGFRRSRTSTTNVNATVGANLFPNNFFDNPEIKTDDFTYAENTNNKLTVSVTGWYLVSVSLLFSTGIKADRFYMTLYKNGTVVDRNGTTAWGQDSGITGAEGASGMFLVYCAKNDYLQPGYTISASITGLFDGEATGTQTYWSVAFLGNTKPLEPTTT